MMIWFLFTMAACLLVPAFMLEDARRVVARAAMPEDKRYYAELWRVWHNSALYTLAQIYGLMAFPLSIMINTSNIVLSQILLDLPVIVWFIICYRKMAHMRDNLVPETEFKQYAAKCASLKFRVYACLWLSLFLVVGLCGVIFGSNDSAARAMLVGIGMTVAIFGSMYITMVRYISPSFDRILPASEMEMLRGRLAEAGCLLNQHLPASHSPVKLEITGIMMAFGDSFQCVSVEMKSEKRISVSLLGLKRLDQNELLFLSLSGAFCGFSTKSQIQADQRSLEITTDHQTALSALRKELDTAFGYRVRFLQKRIKALEVI